MNTKYIVPPDLAPPPEPYAHGVEWQGLVFVSGQVAFDEENRIVGVGDAEAQARQVWRNIASVVEAADGVVTDVVKITVFLSDIRHAQAEIAVRQSIFPTGKFPICTLVQVANLGLPDLLMEIDAIAVVGRSAGIGSTGETTDQPVDD